MKRFLIPLVAFAALAVFLGIGLRHDPHELPSPLIGRAAPAFTLPRLAAADATPVATFTPADLRGQVWLLNVWASWCVSCRQEHPVLMDLARSAVVPLVGLDYKDAPADARRWLAQDLRREIRTLIRSGKSDAEILDFLVSRYGDFVRYRPPLKPSTWLLWLGPFVLLAGALAALIRHVRRPRRTEAPLSDADRARAAALLAGER
jgi:thiol-disulfide isomerase/thioredoxin